VTESYDLVGIGIGPSNLSLAALLEPHPELRVRFFDRRPEFQWHPGLLFPGATIQVSFMKDLVTLADPTSRFSFLSFLKAKHRLYRFINAEFERVHRREFNEYLRWVCDHLESLEFGRAVDSVALDGEWFVVSAGAERVLARHLVLGVGTTPVVPECAQTHLGPTVFHAAEYLDREPAFAGKRVAVVGGGQTGAEVVEHVLADPERLPARLSWISRRGNFLPLDESPFVNELFTPSYSRFFAELPQDVRERVVRQQKLASDGISPRTLLHLIRRLYELEFLDSDRTRAHLWPAHELRGIERRNGAWALDVVDLLRARTRAQEADVVVLCTGFESSLPPIAPLLERLRNESGQLSFEGDYSIVWDGAPRNRIYAQNHDRRVWGIADPNVSLMAWRSALIANSLLGRDVYDTADDLPLLDWGDR
jgi:lysine N6-hydroxylase